MKTSNRTFQITLLLLAVADGSLGYLFLFDPATISRIYGGAPLDNMHLYLSVGLGCLLITFAIGALFAFFRPIQNAAIAILLILSHFSLFIADVVALARNQMVATDLLPEMGYYLTISLLLIRFYPSKIESKDLEDQKDPEEPKERDISSLPSTSSESSASSSSTTE
ncbi:MAG: hypothetical protein O2904_03165 [bacterium]|nr:hypothetical protein [bacterium]